MKKIRFITLIVLSSIIITACGSSDETIGGTELSSIDYKTEEFSITVPNSWEILEAADFTSNVPPETVLAFRNNIKNEFFTANANITKTDLETLENEITVRDFAKSSLTKIKNTLVSFKELGSKKVDVPFGGEVLEGYFASFEGKQIASEEMVRFQQIYLIKDKIAYTLTIAYLQNEDESVVKMLEKMLDSFTLL